MPHSSSTPDPDEIKAEIQSLNVTDQPILTEHDKDIHPGDLKLIGNCYVGARSGSRFSIVNLKKLIKKYPKNPVLKNNLSLAYHQAGEEEKADQLSLQIFREHPDYLFAKMNRAGMNFEDLEKARKIPELLGDTLQLSALLPDREKFHVTEVNGYYLVVGLYYLRLGHHQAAMAVRDGMQNLLGKDDPNVQRLHDLIIRMAFN